MFALAARSRPRGALRTLGMVLAIALCAGAVYLVVVGHTQKQVQVGLLVGLWGALLGAFALCGPRRNAADEGESLLAHGDRALVRSGEHDQQFAVMLRRETERVVREELSQLRNEVAGLRSDLVEKVNGQLRLERIETTRVISSDIEELQHEVRRLAVASRTAQQAMVSTGFPSSTVVETEVRTSAPVPYVLAGSTVHYGAGRPAQRNPGPAPAAPAASPLGGPSPAQAAPRPAPGVVPHRAAAMQPRPTPPPLPPATTPPRPALAHMPPPSPHPPERVAEPVDPLQGLPRLSRFEHDWESAPERSASAPPWELNNVGPGAHPQSPSFPESYVGRRRSAGDAMLPPSNGAGGSSPNGTNGHNSNGAAPGNRSGSGRRRRAGDQADDVLGRLLGR